MKVFQLSVVPLSLPIVWFIQCKSMNVGGFGRVVMSHCLLWVLISGSFRLVVHGFNTLVWTLVWCPQISSSVSLPNLVHSWWGRSLPGFWSSFGAFFCGGLPAFSLGWAFPWGSAWSFLMETPCYNFYRSVFVLFFGTKLLMLFDITFRMIKLENMWWTCDLTLKRTLKLM